MKIPLINKKNLDPSAYLNSMYKVPFYYNDERNINVNEFKNKVQIFATDPCMIQKNIYCSQTDNIVIVVETNFKISMNNIVQYQIIKDENTNHAVLGYCISNIKGNIEYVIYLGDNYVVLIMDSNIKVYYLKTGLCTQTIHCQNFKSYAFNGRKLITLDKQSKIIIYVLY